MAADVATIRVSVVHALPGQAWTVDLDLPAGTTASEAMSRSGLAGKVPDMDTSVLTFAIFGKAIEPATMLRDGDRLELLRPLLADPKQARQQRARGKGR